MIGTALRAILCLTAYAAIQWLAFGALVRGDGLGLLGSLLGLGLGAIRAKRPELTERFWNALLYSFFGCLGGLALGILLRRAASEGWSLS